MAKYPADLAIYIAVGDERRIAWGDRERGYLELFSKTACRGAGYMRGNARRLRDLMPMRGSAVTDRAHCGMRLLPGEISQGGLSFGLLMEEGAAWISIEGDDPGQRAPNGQAWTDTPTRADGFALALPRSRQPWRFDGGPYPAWSREADPAQAYGEACALASSEAFSYFGRPAAPWLRIIRQERLEAFRLEPAAHATAGASPRAFPGGAELYLAWGKDAREARDKARRLARSGAIERHRQRIASFLSGAHLSTALEDYDRAIAWAAFSGWSLVTREYGLGIWAGLPWFRDNWGRDSFIALPGILLVSGRFSEAKEIIASFAERQERDEGSPHYGRVPNRWRGPDDVIFNTADGTPWFVRACWLYAQYTGDEGFLTAIAPAVYRALDADLSRCDEQGFLMHGPADTWMDARIRGKEAWSPRGDRAVEVQALFYTALLCGARIAEGQAERIERLAAAAKPEERSMENGAHDSRDRAARYRAAAARLKGNFTARYWFAQNGRLADCLRPESEVRENELSGCGAALDGVADLRSRPNALMAISVPALLDEGEQLLSSDIQAAILADCVPELVYPYGVTSLSQEDPFFHGNHDGSSLHHKDAAYHNGAIWGWNAGFAIEALLRHDVREPAWDLSAALTKQILEGATPGSMSENLHALPGPDGKPVESGAYAQAWSVAEFSRNAFECYLGFKPRLLDGLIVLAPRLPQAWGDGQAQPRFGPNERMSIRFARDGSRVSMDLLWLDTPDASAGEAAIPSRLGLELELPGPRGVTRHTLTLDRGAPLSFSYDEERGGLSIAQSGAPEAVRQGASGGGRFLRPRQPCLEGLSLAKPRLSPWNGAASMPDYLERLILAGDYDTGPLRALAAWFDSDDFALRYHSDEELGSLWAPEATEFRLWAPTALRVVLLLWDKGDGGDPRLALPMEQGDKGVWKLLVAGDLHGAYYGYRVRAHGLDRETIDPYARSAGLNGKRGMVLDPERACPPGWDAFSAPACESPNDAIVWEAHIRDLTSKPSWHGPEGQRCGYRGACYTGTALAAPAAARGSGLGGQLAIPTGFDHVTSLGVTHVQLLPVFDFVSVDEARVRDPAYRALRERGAFNWGYDPGNYAAPEGSYASDPADGECRVRELRGLVLAYGKEGIGVIMDVVYNHVPELRRSALEACVPGYYFRGRRDSGAGDDTASERYMFRRYMGDTLCWWLSGYKLSGFRFDLMGLHDLKAMRYIESRLRAIKPDLLLYGEGWNMYKGGRDGFEPADQTNVRRLPGFGMFNDAFRDGVKGSVFDAGQKGWIQGGTFEESVKFGLVGSVRHRQVKTRLITGTAMPRPWGERSAASVNYVEAHDNLTLRDKLELAEPGKGDEYYARLARLALSLTLTAQGMPLLHAGGEFLRSKRFPSDWLAEGLPDKAVCLPGGDACFCHDSYKFSDQLNGLDWELAATHRDSVAYLRALIALRKRSPYLRLSRGADIRSLLRFHPSGRAFLAWSIAANRKGGLFIAASALDAPAAVRLPPGSWRLLADSAAAAAWPEGGARASRSVLTPAKGAIILERED